MEQLEFLIKLDERMSGPASKATQGLRSLEAQIRKEQAALAGLEAKISSTEKELLTLLSAEEKNTKAIDAQLKKLEQLKTTMGKKKSVLDQLNTSLPKYKDAASKSSVASDALNSIMGKLGLSGLTMGAGIAAATAALVAGAGALAAYGLAAADARRSQLLTLEGLLGSAGAAKELDASISRLSDRVPLTRQRLDEMGKTLSLANLRGDELSKSLESLAITESVAGTQAANMLSEVIKVSKAGGAFKLSSDQLKDTGLEIANVYAEIAAKTGQGVDKVEALVKAGKISVGDGLDALNAAVQNRFGDVSEKQVKGLGVQLSKLQDNIGRLFEGAAIEPFLDGLHMVTSLFSESSVSGQGMGFLIQTVFTKLFSVASKVFPAIKAIIQEFIIAGLRVYIVLAPVFRAVAEGFERMMPAGAGFGTVMRVVATVLATTVAVAFGIVTSAVATLAIGIGTAIRVVGTWWDLIGGFASDIIGVFASIDWSAPGGDIIDGIISGLTGAAGRLYESVKGVASGAVDSFKNMLGISSPSKVFAGLGMNTAEGFSMGVDDGAQGAQESVDNLVKPLPLAGGTPAAGGAGNAAGAGAGAKISIGGVTMNISGVAGAEQLEGMLPTMLVKAFEQMGITAAIEAEA